MGLNKAEIKLKRLLASIPNQENPRKLLHYVATAKELLAVLTGDNGPQNLASISPDLARDYADRIQEYADKIDINDTDIWNSLSEGDKLEEQNSEEEPVQETSSSTLRRRKQPEQSSSMAADDRVVELDTSTQEHIEKQRRLQEVLTDKLLDVSRQMKMSSLTMEDAVRESNKILSSAEDALDKSLSSAGTTNLKAKQVYSRSFKTACFTWLTIFAMLFVFVFMVVIIRIT